MFFVKTVRIKYLFRAIQHQWPIYISRNNFNKLEHKYKHSPCDNEHLNNLIEKYKDKIIYNTFLDSIKPKRIYTQKGIKFQKRLIKEEKAERLKYESIEPLPVALKYFSGQENAVETLVPESEHSENNLVNFPFGNQTATLVHHHKICSMQEDSTEEPVANTAYREVKQRQELYKDVDFSKWMMDYENYEDCGEEEEAVDKWRINYGTSDPNSIISDVPCGGCGALLHCKDTAIPGYIPSEIYKNSFNKGGVHLKAIICQRCYFLKNYDLALQVRVTSEDYPRILGTIKKKKALIILMVDLLDFPCSVWPGIVDILGSNKPIVVVGNKVDLLPRDSRGYLEQIKKTLKENVHKVVGKDATTNIKHVALISAKTGWGVEELITKLHNLWKVRGDVYLVGCTNVGKSTLFNCLLQSDYCKIQAVDLVQRATTSVWPGTTLNLLKFPILRPSGWRLHVRTKRLQSLHKLQAAEVRLNKLQLSATRDPKYATLMGHLDRTFTPEAPVTGDSDPFSIQGHANASGKPRFGINEKDPAYATSKWCYDTPGVVQPDQIIHLLTTDELMLTLPKQLLRPQTFSMRVGQTLFIAGIGRLDYVDGPYSIRITVFCADSLPLTLCLTEGVDSLYKELLGTEIFKVPNGSNERLSKWPHLEARDLLKLTGEGKYKSCGDIVLSNAGWIAITCDSGYEASFKAWMPEARGIYVRKSVLPYAVELRGKKIRRSPAYTCNKFYIQP
ncbi:hypothetical protein ILUMI_01130 [Ignelater luminosus]|uniref:G domain-containing protein n=1 Tax=Ignelater luminosus TaxID=2038154 RepID=A0A8K0DKP3_IGNLU|nr:hypothetical protein ILUMI_01130 [Ignelater luminosus]